MTKIKSKKTSLSEKIQNKRKKTVKVVHSPFEVHINKQKLKVLGRKTKHDKGFPGLSRSKAIDKRKKTLLEEYKVRNKSNLFKDRRIAERDPSLTVEEKQMARFAAIRQKAHKKKSIFNLGDDDEIYPYTEESDLLTHNGQSLSEIEKFEDPRSDDEIDNDDDGNLDRKFVEQVHFGGGFLTTNQQDGPTSHKDILEQIIIESKKRKAEKKQTKEELSELTEKLNSEWDDFVPLTKENIRKAEDKKEDPLVDDFGKKKNQLKFEPRCTPSDATKSEEEIAIQEKERLDRLEKERLERMMSVDEVHTDKYKSADDLDDNFVYESLSGDESDEGEKHTEDNDGDEGEKHTEDNDSDNNSVDNPSDIDSDDEDNLSDLKTDTSDSEEEINDEEPKLSNEKSMKPPLNFKETETKEQHEDIPLSFSFPENDEILSNLLNKHSAINQGKIIDKIMKNHNLSLSEGNKEKLALLFKYILQYINDIASESKNTETLMSVFSIFDVLSPHLFDLAQINQKSCSDAVREVIKEKFQEFLRKSKLYPGLEVLFFLKMVSYLFPTSDFKHSVVTPCFIFIEKMLMTCRIRTRRHISYGLFLSTLVLEYTILSKRYMPGCVNFLGGIVHMAVSKSSVRIIKVVPPFKSLSSDLVLLEDCSKKNVSLKMEVDDLIEEEVTESFKIRALYTAIMLCSEFLKNFTEYPSRIEIFETIYEYCQMINSDVYPEDVRKGINTFIKTFEDDKNNRKLNYMKMESAKPKLLKLYEPNIVEVYDRKSHKLQSREKAEHSKLLHKLKREKKGALREIRRDNDFLGRVKLSKQIESDQVRREKVKRIYAEANMQQSELNALERKKKKK